MGFGDMFKSFVSNLGSSVAKQVLVNPTSIKKLKKDVKYQTDFNRQKDVGIFAGPLNQAHIDASKQTTDDRTKEKKNIAIQEQTDAQVAFEADITQSEKEAKRKAAEEQLARRRGTPGRPVFTSLSNKGTLLQ